MKIRAVPYLETLLGKLSKVQLDAVKTAIDSSSNTKNYSLVTAGKVPTADNKGINGCVFELELGKVKNGIFVYVDVGSGDSAETLCVLLAYNIHNQISAYEINLSASSYARVDEKMSVEELRSTLDDQIESKGGKPVPISPAKLAEIMEGDIGLSVDLNASSTKVVAALDLTGGTAGKVLAIDSTGEDVEWATRNKLYRHRVHYAQGDDVLDFTFETNYAQEIDGANGVVACATAHGILDAGLYFIPVYCKVNTDYYQICECSLGQGLVSVKLVSYGEAEDITLNPNGTFTDTVVEVI